MGKKNVRKIKNQSNVSQANSYIIKGKENLLKEKVLSLITNPNEKLNFLAIAINNKDLRLLKLFFEKGGKLTEQGASQYFEYIAVNDSVEILKYFIETLKLDFNKPLENLNPIPMLHLAAMYGAEKCVTYLLKSNYNINKLDSGGYKPLEYAVLSKHTDIAKLLIQKGAEIDIGIVHNLAKTYNDKEAGKLLDIIPNPVQKINSYMHYISVKQNPDTNIYKNINNNLDEQLSSFQRVLTSLVEDAKPRANYYKLILGKEHHLLSKVVTEQQEFINNKLNTITNQDINTKDIISHIFNIISLVTDIHKIFDFNGRGELEKYILDILEKTKNLSEEFSSTLFFFASDLMNEAYETGKYLETIKYAKIMEENSHIIQGLPKNAQAEVFKNLGIIYSNFDSIKALNYLSKAELLNPSISGNIERKYSIYLYTLHNLEAAIAEAEKVTDSELKALLIINAYKKLNIARFNDISLQHGFNELSPDKFKSDPLKSFVYYDIKAQQYINFGQCQKAYNLYDQLLNQAVTINNNVLFFDTIHNYLMSYWGQKDWINGCKLLDTIYQKHPNILNNHSILKLKVLEFAFYSENGSYLIRSDKILEDIKVETLTDKEWVKFISMAYQIRFYDANFNQKVKEKLSTYIKNIEKLYEYASNSALLSNTAEQLLSLIQKGKSIQNILSHQEQLNNKIVESGCTQEEKTKEIIEAPKKPTISQEITQIATPITSNIQQEPFVRALPKESKVSFKDIEKLIKVEDYITLAQYQKQVKNYFKFKKAELQQYKMQELFSIKDPILWHTKKGDFISDSENVIEINEKKCYATIDPKLENKLDSVTYNMFTKALKKGEAARSEGIDGVKFISDNLIELKLSDSDTRLYTNKIYTNGDNKLIIFNKLGNHEAVNNAATECRIEYIGVNNCDDSVSVTGNLI